MSSHFVFFFCYLDLRVVPYTVPHEPRRDTNTFQYMLRCVFLQIEPSVHTIWRRYSPPLSLHSAPSDTDDFLWDNKSERNVFALHTVPRWPGGCVRDDDASASARIAPEGREELRISLYSVCYTEFLSYLKDFSAVFVINCKLLKAFHSASMNHLSFSSRIQFFPKNTVFSKEYRYAPQNDFSVNDGPHIDSGPVRLWYYNIILYNSTLLTTVLQLSTVFSTVTCCTGL